MHQKKVTSKTSLTNISKSEKSAYFRHVFANNFFWVHFFKTFSTDSKSVWNSAFFIPKLNFLIKIFFALISTFCTLWLQMRRKRLKKTENLFLWMCLRILLGNHQRVCIYKLLKSLYPNVHTLILHNRIYISEGGWWHGGTRTLLWGLSSLRGVWYKRSQLSSPIPFR